MKSVFSYFHAPFFKRLFILLTAALLVVGSCSGCFSGTKQKTKTNEEDTSEDTSDKNTEGKESESIRKPEEEKEKSDTVIAPNTVYDPDDSSEAKNDSENSSKDDTSNSAGSTTGSEEPSKPIVGPETEPDEVTELDKKTAEEMLPLFDSLILAATASADSSYDAASPEFVWTALYLAIVNYAEEGQNGVSYTDDYLHKIAPANLVREYASGMFSGMKSLPAIPDSMKDSVSHLSDRDAYQFTSSDRGASYTTLTEITSESDGTYLVSASLRTPYGENEYAVHADFTFRVVENPLSGSGSSVHFPFSVTEIVSSSRK